MPTVAVLPFLLFTLSADTLTQRLDVSKLTWATDVYRAAAAFTSAVVGAMHLLSRQGRWPGTSLRSIRSPYKVYRFAAGDQGIFCAEPARAQKR